MKRGFTLLELIVVVIILGILATLATTQYTRMIEKSRGAEARVILGSIRSNAAAYYMSNNYNCSGISGDQTLVGIGTDYSDSCDTTLGGGFYFDYSLSSAGSTNFVGLATRCTANGKTPAYATGGNITLTTNFANGSDVWTYSTPY